MSGGTGVLADLDPPRFGPPGPNMDPRSPYPLADLNPPPRIVFIAFNLILYLNLS